jgi:transposase
MGSGRLADADETWACSPCRSLAPGPDLTEKGLLRPSFVPPPEIRRLRDYTRLREDLTRDRTRHWQRLEKLLEDALIKVSSVASTMITLSTRDMIEALIAGERDPYRLAELARGKMKAKRSELITALDGRFDDHTPNWRACCWSRSMR